jgi:hypothetical protein
MQSISAKPANTKVFLDVIAKGQTFHPVYRLSKSPDLWSRRQDGQSTNDIGRALVQRAAPNLGVVRRNDGFASPLPRRSPLALTFP